MHEVYRVALQRPGDCLSRASGLRPFVGCAVGGRAAHGAQRPRGQRRDVHARHRFGIPRGGIHHGFIRTGRDGRARRRQSGRVLSFTKPALRAGRPAVLRRNLGAKAIKMVYAPVGSADRVQTVDVPREERARFSISDADATALARQALTIEQHYGCPMDIEWGKDGATGRAVHSAGAARNRAEPHGPQRPALHAQEPRSRCSRRAAASASASVPGVRASSQASRDIERVQPGDVLVADMTDPDWEPVMKRASAIVTNRGGRTCHAAIIARELGMPAVVGCGDATQAIRPKARPVTVSCAEGDTGYVYQGLLGVRSSADRARPLPQPRRENHDERRQPRPRVCVCAAAERRGGSCAPRVHHQPHDRCASAGRCSSSISRREVARRRSVNRWPATQIR